MNSSLLKKSFLTPKVCLNSNYHNKLTNRLETLKTWNNHPLNLMCIQKQIKRKLKKRID